MVAQSPILNKFLALVSLAFLISCSTDGDKEIAGDDTPIVEDTTPPTISLQGLVTNQVLSEVIQISANISDDIDQNVNLKVLLESEEIYDSNSTYSFEFDPNLYAPGEKTLRFVVTDGSTNSNAIEIKIKIQRILLRLMTEENYIRNPIEEAYAFLSDLQGNPLDSIELGNQTDHTFLAPFSFDAQQDFILTVVAKEVNGAINIESTPHLNRGKVTDFYLKNQGRFDFESIQIEFGSTGFSHLEGLGYGYFVFTPDQNIGTLDLLDRQNPTENIFILSPGGPVNGTHFVARLKRDTISDPLVLTSGDFSSDNISVGNFPYTDTSQIGLLGYENEDDFQNYRFHNVLFGIGQIVNSNRILHPYVDDLPFYSHSYTDLYGANLDGYRYLGEGLPLNEYNPAETDLVTALGNASINISFTPISNFFSGKIHLKSENQNSNWTVGFNANTDKNLALPKMPNLGGLETLDLTDFSIKSSRISKYANVSSYDEYITKVKSMAINYYQHSSFVEHITVWPELDNREEFLDPLQ
ncbi:hypothetical protein [Flagellimonas flava]|uniref:Uncharacterized protein n=1 Tax=Flagellimonas flava TaxID=570519 RepID=A0A1M5MF72_9FLAO|nr:hypothetical protein [Allomuricauda flava]SHG76064.1 hypothetical protein SAMN04488116_2426 [Allomuricauda flava]